MKDENYLKGIDYAMDIGHVQYLDHMKKQYEYVIDSHRANRVYFDSDHVGYGVDDCLNGIETHLYDFDGLFVEVTLPRGEFE